MKTFIEILIALIFQAKSQGVAEDIKRVELPNHSIEQNEIMNYAFEISNDKEFLYLLKAENGEISLNRKSSTGDYGLCQINKKYHPEIVNDPRFFTDYKFQVDKCFELYKNGTKFYAMDKLKKDKKFRKKIEKFFIFNN